MNFRQLILVGIFFLFAGVLYSCMETEEYPDIPAIEYVSFTKIDNGTGIDEKGILMISFTDGDGNIGLAEGDTNSPYNIGSQWYYNFFINYYELRKGVLTKIELPFTLNARIPPIEGSGPNAPTKGDIEIELYFNNPATVYDTIVFEASICDRDLQVSNVVRSDYIIVKKH